MDRTNCVICNERNFIDNFNLLNTINIVSSDFDINENNEIKNLKFVSCTNCGCVQLKNLFLQSEIYSQPLQIVNGANFNGHHDLFCDFIIKNINYEKEILEIGGAYGSLAKRIISNYNKNNYDILYKIMEYDSSFYPPIEQIKYMSGDCDNYNFTNANVNTIIMSHVFEHLYKPNDFLKNIYESSIENVFISIPDMDSLTLNGDLNNLNILHTFYINTQYIVYLFFKNGFNIKQIENYNNNSNFYYFKKETLNIKYILPSYKNLQLPLIQKDFYEKNYQKIQNININSPFYICPSGFYGQFIYFNLNETTKKNLLGFLDSDPFKINKRLSGTNLKIFEKKIIEKKQNERKNESINNELIHILISSQKHTNEIKNELITYNDNILFYYI